ncbi:hypothetical protein JEQ12_013035 [Ovis aries]|uniref:Orange domain-containing protein n=1 Tax=Ovis aries TaxID=9940 RepID=A0A835ZM23_SHEEP|nr:hypothetical protein JEQ12_013035 [Ovis aries]
MKACTELLKHLPLTLQPCNTAQYPRFTVVGTVRQTKSIPSATRLPKGQRKSHKHCKGWEPPEGDQGSTQEKAQQPVHGAPCSLSPQEVPPTSSGAQGGLRLKPEQAQATALIQAQGPDQENTPVPIPE